MMTKQALDKEKRTRVSGLREDGQEFNARGSSKSEYQKSTPIATRECGRRHVVFLDASIR